MNLPSMGETWMHKRKKSKYKIVRLCRIRNYDDNCKEKWSIGVFYTEVKSVDFYVREYLDFMENFKRIKE